jgi:hypothetical protein
VSQRQPNPRATRKRVGMRSALATEVWKKDQTFTAERRDGGFRHQFIEAVPGASVPRTIADFQRVIIEVLSDSTEAFDRGAKFLRYRNWNPSLTDYILVSQFEVIVEHYVRQPDGSWSIYVYQGLEDSIFIKSINCTLRLAEAYDRVVFPAEPAHEPGDEQ